MSDPFGLTIGFRLPQAKALFFDRAAVTSQIDPASRRVLSKFGAYVRRSARSSIRQVKKKPPAAPAADGKKRRGRPAVTTSAPGKPPLSHTGLLRDNIFFFFDRSRRSVVIGPIRLNKPGIAPESLEYGGDVPVFVKKKQVGTVKIAARPFMGPAFRANEPKLPEMWRNAITR
jgi:hypothetical protein